MFYFYLKKCPRITLVLPSYRSRNALVYVQRVKMFHISTYMGIIGCKVTTFFAYMQIFLQ